MNEKDMTYDEQNGLWYERQGDYYIPCLTLTEKEQKPIGIWGRRHLRYIKQQKRGFYNELVLSGKLAGYLADTDAQAKEMFLYLLKQLTLQQNVTEELKARDQMAWVRAMNAIRAQATEVVLYEMNT